MLSNIFSTRATLSSSDSARRLKVRTKPPVEKLAEPISAPLSSVMVKLAETIR